jgi:hypothetical protein
MAASFLCATSQQPAGAGCQMAARAVQRSSTPARQQASCALSSRSRPVPAAGWWPVQCRGRTRQQASCAPPPGSLQELAAGWRPVQCRGRPRQHCGKLPMRHHPASGRSAGLLPDGGPCSVEVVHASKLPVLHQPTAGQSRLLVGGPCCVEVVHASKLPMRHHPAAGRNRLPDGSP